MGIKFEQGHTYNVVKTLGVIMKAGGFLQITQHTGKDGPDITADEPLAFDGRGEGKLWFKRSDGTRVSGHPSHFDAANAYNLKGEAIKADPGTLEARIGKARAKVEQRRLEMEAAADRLAKLLSEIETAKAAALAAQEATPVEPEADGATVEARDEAAELLAAMEG